MLAEARLVPCCRIAAVTAAAAGVDKAIVVADMVATMEAFGANSRGRVDLARDASIRHAAALPDGAAANALGLRA